MNFVPLRWGNLFNAFLHRQYPSGLWVKISTQNICPTFVTSQKCMYVNNQKKRLYGAAVFAYKNCYVDSGNTKSFSNVINTFT